MKILPSLTVAVAACGLLLTGCTSSSGGGGKHSGASGASGATSSGPSTSSSSAPAGNSSGTASGSGGAAAPTVSAPSYSNDREPTRPKDQTGVLKSLPGSTAKTCGVVSASTTDLRVGSIAAGNFSSARSQFKSQYGTTEVPELSMYAIPQNLTGVKTLTLTVTPKRGGAAKTVTVKNLEQANGWSYFPLQVPISAPGAYRLTMVAGANRGCFDVTFAK